MADACDLGKWSETVGGSCADCPSLYSCDRSTRTKTLCTQGWYSAAGDWECLLCPAGKDCWTGAAT